MLKGIGASDGIGIGKALRLTEQPVVYEDRPVSDAAAEKARLDEAVRQFTDRSEARARRMDESGSDGQILRGHIAMLNDPYMLSQIQENIDQGMIAEKAVEAVCDLFITIFSSTEDELTRQRAADVGDIKRQLLKLLIGIAEIDLQELPPDTVLVVEELTPSMTAEMDVPHIAGILTEKGGRTSHSAIISRSLRIPAVLSIPDALQTIEDGTEVILDGTSGEVYLSPSADEIAHYRALAAKQAEQTALLEQYRGRPTLTADGLSKDLYANIGSPKDLSAVLEGDAEGIGLFRTEFLFMDRTALPTEEEQFEAYKTVAVSMKEKEVIIRTLDIGGDKEIPYLGLSKEENPFLGFRAVRYCLAHPELYRTQLRAILRASAYGNIAIMIPLVTRVEEILQVRSLLNELKTELDCEHIPYKQDIQLGIMVETPAACLMADIFARHADFFSIGTNDLTGYVMAADRGNGDVTYLYSVYDPAVLRAIRRTILCAKAEGIRCGMCGEAAADPALIPLLLSFGLDEFSMSPTSLLCARARIAELDREHCDLLYQKVLSCETEAEVRRLLTFNA